MTPSRSRASHDEEGVVAVTVGIVLAVLLGFTALAFDISSMHLQKRQLQNSADAGALAVAQDCARGECPSGSVGAGTRAHGYTVANMSANGTPGNFAGAETSAQLGNGNVAVTVTEENTPLLRQVVGQGPTTVRASARAIWGRPSALAAVLPATFSICEYEHFAGTGPTPPNLAPPPPYDAGYPNPEIRLIMHGAHWTGTCARGPAGQMAAGNWGWIASDANCITQTHVGRWFRGQPGTATPDNACKAAFEKYLGQTVYLPIYSARARSAGGMQDATGNNIWYYVEGYAAFYLTGYRAPSVVHPSIATGWICDTSESCLSGYFTSGLVPANQLVGGSIEEGNLTGAVAVRLSD